MAVSAFEMSAAGRNLDMILQTERLDLRCLTREDLPALRMILQDEETMYAYNGAFSEEETVAWLNRQTERYQKDGFGLWAVALRDSGEVIGQCGLTWQPWKDREVLEIGYLFQRAYWHRGYAIEAALACKEYAFSVLQAKEVCSVIRDSNIPSQRVALRCGMQKTDTGVVKFYRGVHMPHDLYSVKSV